MSGDSTQLSIDVRRVSRYFRLCLLLPAVLIGVMLLLQIGTMIDASGSGFLVTSPLWVALVALVAWFVWYPGRRAAALRYWLEGSTLRIDEGVLIRKRKSIPLDRVTDVALVQGPFMRLCRIWALQVQTAGSSQQAPEGTLYGLVDAEPARDAIMRARDAAAGADGRRHDH